MKYPLIIDPKELKEGFPIIVLATNANAFIAWAIRCRTKGSYNHVMWMTKPMTVTSQDLVYKEKSLEKYLNIGSKTKFFKIRNMSYYQKTVLEASITKKLKKPWWKRRYDFMGILGQALGIRFINNPFTDFCSESVARDLIEIKLVPPYKPSPADLNRYFMDNPDIFEYLGHYFSE